MEVGELSWRTTHPLFEEANAKEIREEIDFLKKGNMLPLQVPPSRNVTQYDTISTFDLNNFKPGTTY